MKFQYLELFSEKMDFLSILVYVHWKSAFWVRPCLKTSLWRHTLTDFHDFGINGKRRPYPIPWYQTIILWARQFQVHKGGGNHPLGKPCYKKRLGRTRVKHMHLYTDIFAFYKFEDKNISFLMYWALLPSIKIRIPWDIVLIKQVLPENHAFLPKMAIFLMAILHEAILKAMCCVINKTIAPTLQFTRIHACKHMGTSFDLCGRIFWRNQAKYHISHFLYTNILFTAVHVICVEVLTNFCGLYI